MKMESPLLPLSPNGLFPEQIYSHVVRLRLLCLRTFPTMHSMMTSYCIVLTEVVLLELALS